MQRVKFKNDPAVRRTAVALAGSLRARVVLRLVIAWCVLTCAVVAYGAVTVVDPVLALLLLAVTVILTLVPTRLVQLHRLVSAALRDRERNDARENS